MSVNLLAFAGSTRKDSFNKKLVSFAASRAEAHGASVTVLDLAELPLPVYDGDLEEAQGLPENVIKIKDLMLEHDGFLIASPEYNSSVSAVLKNVIDWTSRPREGEGRLACFSGKTAAVFSASPGALGGLRGLVHIRAILGNLHTIVIPDQYALSKAHEAFGDSGELTDQKQSDAMDKIAKRLVEVTAQLKGE